MTGKAPDKFHLFLDWIFGEIVYPVVGSFRGNSGSESSTEDSTQPDAKGTPEPGEAEK